MPHRRRIFFEKLNDTYICISTMIQNCFKIFWNGAFGAKFWALLDQNLPPPPSQPSIGWVAELLRSDPRYPSSHRPRTWLGVRGGAPRFSYRWVLLFIGKCIRGKLNNFTQCVILEKYFEDFNTGRSFS